MQYTHGVANPDTIAPESYTLDYALLQRPGMDNIQLDLFLNYASNVALYPVFQKYFRDQQPPFLAIWGKNDPFSFLRARKRTSGTIPMPRSSFSIPGTLRWKRTSRK